MDVPMTDRQVPIGTMPLQGGKPELDMNEFDKLIQQAEEWYVDQHEVMDIDMAMYSGQQFPEDVLESRKRKKRPAFVTNILGRYVDSPHNRMDNDGYTISVSSRDLPGEDVSGAAEAPFAVMNDDSMRLTRPQVLEGMLRHMFEESNFRNHRSKVSKDMLALGLGFWRVHTDYEDGNSANRTLRVQAIENPKDVLLDPCATEQDGRDASWAAITTYLTPEEARRQYPKIELHERATGYLSALFSNTREVWSKGDVIRVIEFIRCYEKEQMYVLLTNNTRMLASEYEKTKDELQAAGIVANAKRVFYDKTYWKWVIVNRKIVKGPELLPYKFMPVVPVYGRKRWIEGKPIYHSNVRDGEGIQRAWNWLNNSVVEQAMLASHSPWVGDPRAISGFKEVWMNQYMEAPAFLPVNQFVDGVAIKPPERPQRIAVDEATLQAMGILEKQIEKVMGLDEGYFGYSSNSTSARSSQFRTAIQEMGASDFSRSLQVSIEAIGRVILSAIPEVFTNNRLVQIRTPDGFLAYIPINTNWVYDEQTGEPFLMDKLSGGDMDVSVRAVPGDATRKSEALSALSEVLKTWPEARQVLTDKIFELMDTPIASEIRERAMAAVPVEAMNAREQQEWKARQIAAFKIQLETQAEIAQLKQEAGVPDQPSPDEVAAQAKASKAQSDAEKAAVLSEAAAANAENSQAQAQRTAQQSEVDLAKALLEVQQKQREAEASTDERTQDAANRAALEIEAAKENSNG